MRRRSHFRHPCKERRKAVAGALFVQTGLTPSLLSYPFPLSVFARVAP